MAGTQRRCTNTHTHARTWTHTDVYCCRRIPLAVTTTLLRINCLSLLHYLIGRLAFSLQYITWSRTLFTPAHANVLRCCAVPGEQWHCEQQRRDNARDRSGRRKECVAVGRQDFTSNESERCMNVHRMKGENKLFWS